MRHSQSYRQQRTPNSRPQRQRFSQSSEDAFRRNERYQEPEREQRDRWDEERPEHRQTQGRHDQNYYGEYAEDTYHQGRSNQGQYGEGRQGASLSRPQRDEYERNSYSGGQFNPNEDSYQSWNQQPSNTLGRSQDERRFKTGSYGSLSQGDETSYGAYDHDGYSRRPNFRSDNAPSTSSSTSYGQQSYGRTYDPTSFAYNGSTEDRHHMQNSHRGRGPKGYTRSDERIREEVCDALEYDDQIDASDIEVNVKEGVVTLSGQVNERYLKRQAEDCVERVRGVKDVINSIQVSSRNSRGSSSASSGSTATRSEGISSSVSTAADEETRSSSKSRKVM